MWFDEIFVGMSKATSIPILTAAARGKHAHLAFEEDR
jgi:hypothetical protein